MPFSMKLSEKLRRLGLYVLALEKPPLNAIRAR